MTHIKHILVTGGAGFLGSNLCERLIKDGHIVVCLDNFHTGVEKNIAHLLQNPNFRVIRHDIATALPIREIPDIDEIYNLACPASPPHYQADPVKTLKASTLGVLNLMDYTSRVKARFLQASTSEVYGDPLEHPQKESYWGNVNPIGIRACYDEGKRAAETLCADYHRHHGVSIRIARIFNTYGPRMRSDDGRVISNFIMQALRNEPLTVYGGGLQTRSFCFVDDLLDGLIRLMASDYVWPVNLGNPDEYTVREIAERIIGLTGSKSEIAYKPLPQDDPTRRCPDITSAKKLLGWQPATSLEDGLHKTIAYFNEIINHA